MRICFPVIKNDGIDSELCNRFSPSPTYVIVDSQNGEVEDIPDIGDILRFGTCDCFEENGGGFIIDAVVTYTMGGALLSKFTRAGVEVFFAEAHTIGGNMIFLKQNRLKIFEIHRTKDNQ